MKEYTDADIVLRIEGAGDELASAKRVVITVDRGGNKLTKDADVDGETVAIHLTPEETAWLGTGYGYCEMTMVMADGMVAKSNTVRIAVKDAIYKEVPDVQGDSD